MALTIKDIAKESGFSISTVSRALNDHKDVSPETKEIINSIIAEHNFVPNKNARRLKQSTSKSIAVFVKGRFNMLFATLIELMQESIEETGYSIHIHYLEEEQDEVKQAIRYCVERKPLGIIFLGGNFKNFEESFSEIKIPCILLTNDGEALGFDNLSSLTIDDSAAAKTAVDYLFRKGHRKIGVVGGMVEMSQTSYQRYQGVLQSYHEHDGDFNYEKYYQKAWYSYKSAYEAMTELLNRAPEMTAVFAMSDVMAIGAIRAIRDRGLSVPQDISVVGFDGVELGSFYNPKLSTIKQPMRELTTRGLEILVSSIEKRKPAVHEKLGFELIESESVTNNH